MPHPVTPYRRPVEDEGLSPGLIVAMWVGGGVAALSLLAILLTSLLGGSDETAGEPSVVKRAAVEKSELAAADQPSSGEAETEVAPWPAVAEQDTAVPDVEAHAPVTESDSTGMEPEPVARPTRPDDVESTAHAPPPKPAAPSPRPPSPAESPGISIRLSGGVALAQTLPTGTAMGFSVDYRFVRGQPLASAWYVWTIQSGDGQVLRQRVQLDSQGTLAGFIPQFRPENGPFETFLEDIEGTRLSETLSLR